MAKSFKARKKARKDSKAPSRIDSTAGVVLPSEGLETETAGAVESLPPPSAEAAPSEPVAGEPTASEPAPVRVEEAPVLAATTKVDEANSKKSESKIAASKNADSSADFSGEFFAKPVEEIHLEEARREAPDLHEEAVVVPRRRVDRRAHQVVIGVLAFAGAIGIAGAVMRKATPRASAATAVAAAQPAPAPAPVPPPQPVVQMAVQPPAPTPAPAPTEAVAAPAPAPAPTETAAPAPTPAAPAPTETVAAAATTAAPAATTAAAVAPAAPAADEDESLTGAQLLSKARQAINSGAASKAAAYAKKAISKGAGGSAYYVLGAAYQTMGSNGAAKGAYGNCAKSGCAEAGECASLAESL